MRKSVYFLFCLVLLSCSSGINHEEARGMFLFQDIKYGDDVKELVDKGKLVYQDNEYSVNTVFNGFDFINDKTNSLYVKSSGGEITGINMSIYEPLDSFTNDSLPRLFVLTSDLITKINNELGEKSETSDKVGSYQTKKSIYTWKKNGLIYTLSTELIGGYDARVFLSYQVSETK